MDTTAGSFALAGSRPRENADIVNQVRDIAHFERRHIYLPDDLCWHDNSRKDFTIG
jgi:hypothetical protein